ncbi:MAG: AmmeMemoRadiSam system protein B [Vicinamibacterales bacterium]|nr:AmmeMemoRadiSam system protein B [Acidobacteriota bacterium]MDP6370956.1 AmmeMemoRadiSam system protein B [Vicinamibacterales bacterium]MDP6607476.1 AmmeMemoRadiSam system protein B [Vicinamibacterales bacterium]HAK55390.1 AmmeMemoRadiSam system protein B [Acidobacteriota bacterium]
MPLTRPAESRPAAVAGTWYPATAGALARELDGYLASTPTPAATLDGAVMAIVAPHAGLMYSGQVAAHAYAAVTAVEFDVVVLVGPSHFVGFDGVALDDRGTFETPLGPLRLEPACAADLASSAVVEVNRDAHQREHSLEMQFPFLKHLMPEVPIVPLVMGFQTGPTTAALADALVASLAERRALLVASTDLAHYVDAARAEALAAPLLEAVRSLDPAAWGAELERYPETDRGRFVACGGGPAVAVMDAARRLGATDGAVLRYGDSGDVSGDKDSVVAYLAAAFGRFSKTVAG